jgi:DNA-binding LytR/AlgR family response regulator
MMTKMIKCAIIEDKEKDIKLLKHVLQADKRFALFETIVNLQNWDSIMSSERFDAVFADIELGQKNVFQLIKTLKHKPELIIVSNYPKYALQAFEYDVIHFLSKPLKTEHILGALERLYKRVILKEYKPIPDSFFLQVGRNKYQQLFFGMITHVTAEGEYVKFHLADDKPVLAYQRLKNVLNELPPATFIQIHRGVVINGKFIKAIDGNTVTLNNKEEIIIGESYRKKLLAFIQR